MDELVSSGAIVTIVIAFMALEAVALLAYRRFSTRRLAVIDIVALLLPGLCLLLALRAALVGSGGMVIAAWLLASLFAHLLDLWRRLRPP